MWAFGPHNGGPTQGTTQRILLANPNYTQRYLELSRSRSGSAQQSPRTGRMNASPMASSTANVYHHHSSNNTRTAMTAALLGRQRRNSTHEAEDKMAATQSTILSSTPLSQNGSTVDFTNTRRWSPRRHAVPRSPWAVSAELPTSTTTACASSALPLCAPTSCPAIGVRTPHYAYPSASSSATLATQSAFASSAHVSSANATLQSCSGKTSEATSSRSNVSHTVVAPRTAGANQSNDNNTMGNAMQTAVVARPRQGTRVASPRRQGEPQRNNNNKKEEEEEHGGRQHVACYSNSNSNSMSSPRDAHGRTLVLPTAAEAAAVAGAESSTGPYFTMTSSSHSHNTHNKDNSTTTEATAMSSAASGSNCKVITPRSHKDVATPGTTNTTTTITNTVTTTTTNTASGTWPSSSFLQSSSPTFSTVGNGNGLTAHETEACQAAHVAEQRHEKEEQERQFAANKAREALSGRYYHVPYSRVNSMTVMSGLALSIAPPRRAEVRCGKAAQMVRAATSARSGFETSANSSAGLTSEITNHNNNIAGTTGAAGPSTSTVEALISARYTSAAVTRGRNGGPVLYSPPTIAAPAMEVRGRNGTALISPAPPPLPSTLYTTGTTTSSRRMGALRLRTSSAAAARCNNNNSNNNNGGVYDRRGAGEGEPRNEVRSARSLQTLAKSRELLRRLVEQWNYVAEESKEAYKEGGYLAVSPGDVLRGRYVVVQKLGWGQFSTVWLSYDKLSAAASSSSSSSNNDTSGRGTPAFVAIKIARCDRSSQHRATTIYEVRLLRYLSLLLPPSCPVTSLLDSFEVNGAYGTHLCMVMPVHGSNLLCVVDAMKAAGLRRRSAQEVRLIKHILLAVLDGLEGLRAGHVLHTDIKPENILCTSPDPKTVAFMQAFCRQKSSHVNNTGSDASMLAALGGRETGEAWRHLVCLADMGLSVVLEPPSMTGTATTIAGQARTSLSHLVGQKKEFHVRRRGVVSNTNGVLIQTREYRAPEVLLGMDFTCETDVWSVGCVAYELITGQFLMDPKRKTRNARQMDIEHLAMMMQLLGPLPPEITELRQKFTAYYDGRDLSSIDLRAARTPPVYLHRYVDRTGGFIYANMYRHYERRQLYKELEPYLGSTDEAMEAASFILMCLYSYEPQYRPTATELKAHSWLHDALK